MRSKTSCFNAAVYRKNLSRFAPVWLLYTLCLIVGVLMLYSNGGTVTEYWFGYHYGIGILEMMGFVSMGYALLVAQLLFGDLFNSRMCNALHAMPVRRESLFFSNLLSGLTVSLVPTAVMTALALVLSADSLFTNASQMVWMVFLGVNLEFLCFFGLAVFSAMCTGNRFAMAAGYGLLNFGACICHFLVDTLYTPMLYGVITPTALMEQLTPLDQMLEPLIETAGKYRDVFDDTGKLIPDVTDSFVLTENWWSLVIWAAVGIGFLAAALVLYRKRDLECAGDAVAFRVLIPVFQVPCAIVVAAAVPFLLQNILGMSGEYYLVIAFGLAVGWFVGKMLTARSTRVFQLKNWVQLGILTAVIAASLFATKLDIFGIETWQPDPEDIERVDFGTGYTADSPYTQPEDIEAILEIQRLALEDRIDHGGSYIMENGVPVRPSYINRQDTVTDIRYAADVHIVYTLKSGKIVNRRYAIWSDQEEGDLTRKLLSSWERVTRHMSDENGREIEVLDLVLNQFGSMNFTRVDDERLAPYQTRAEAESLIAVIRADCAAGNMAQDPFLHNGCFRFEEKGALDGFYRTKDLYCHLDGGDWGWSVDIYPDSTNTIRWLTDRNLLDAEILTDNIAY